LRGRGWLKHSAKGLRCCAVGSGPNIGQWIVAAEFPDAETFGQSQDAVRERN
jgi:hypothetical protein